MFFITKIKYKNKMKQKQINCCDTTNLTEKFKQSYELLDNGGEKTLYQKRVLDVVTLDFFLQNNNFGSAKDAISEIKKLDFPSVKSVGTIRMYCSNPERTTQDMILLMYGILIQFLIEKKRKLYEQYRINEIEESIDNMNKNLIEYINSNNLGTIDKLFKNRTLSLLQ